MSMGKVSIIMATYKTNKDYLNESINSILNQTYQNFEFVIICDGDEKEYNYIKKTYKDKRIRLFLNKENRGLAFSLNKAINFSTGKYIARMDSDDISNKTRIEKQLLFLLDNNLDICGTNAIRFGEENKRKFTFFYNEDEIKIQLLYRATLIHPTVLGKKEVFENYNYNEKFKYSQDFELWNRIKKNYRIGILPKHLFKLRIHKKQVTQDKKQQLEIYVKEIIKSNANTFAPNDKAIFRCLWLLSGRETINYTNSKELNDLIDYFIDKNKIIKQYNEYTLKRVLYNRFFELNIKNRILPSNYSILKKEAILINFIDLIKHIIS
jgi:glycosyltransferase involved in cell wall biosynthesis